MVTLPANASEADILAVVHRWVDLLAQGEYAQAQSLLRRDGAERQWPAEVVALSIASYGPPPTVDAGEESRVTPVSEARVADVQPRASVSRRGKSGRPEVVGDVPFDLPINGVWSDLTAIFFLRQIPGGIALKPFDIHVL
jgi:hypothetical protein